MTAETFSAVVRPASTFSTEKKKGGSYPIGSDGVTALGALTASSTISDVLDICSTIQRDGHEVGPGQIGYATSA